MPLEPTDDASPPLPHAVALTWGVADLPMRGPKRELSIERIVAAAIEIADADGLESVSMTRVASALGFTPMSLYRYVTSKDDLLLLMFEAACDVPLPASTGTWREQLRTWASIVRTAYRRHRWLVDMPPSSTPTTPNRLAVMDAGMRAMSDLEIPERAKVSMTLLLLGYISMFGLAGSDDGVSDEVRQALPTLVTPERFPSLAPAVRDGVFAEPMAENPKAFYWGLARMLDGIETWASRVERTPDDSDDLPLAVLKDRGVREAAKAVLDAEARLEQARRASDQALSKAIDRERAAEEKVAAKAEARAAKASRRAQD